jgi:formamidopyrimidine-DNA glycosylase
MPELPDIELYVARLRERVEGAVLESLQAFNPFVLRSTSPPPSSMSGTRVLAVGRLGKRLLLGFEDDAYAVIHLMIAGRLQWQAPAPPALTRPLGKIQIAAFRFNVGQLTLVESSSRKRASIYLVSGTEGLDAHRRDGLDLFACSAAVFSTRLRARNRTLKRALADPDAFDGIGNAYSDEILFEAKLSPVRLTSSLSEEEAARLLDACRSVLGGWRGRLLADFPGFPKPADITAFRPDFAVHGRFGRPCPVCGSAIQHIVYAENETNYCARCQNEGRLLADRSLSRLLRDDWPKTLEEMEGGARA